MDQRLQKVMASAGVGSRRKCEQLIIAGRVAVDGAAVTELGAKVDPNKSTITIDGKPLSFTQRKYYILLNKPVGYASTRSDPHAKHTVMELVEDVDAFVYPVGRLDVDTSGLLILTNDGELTHLLTHPSSEVEKTYEAVVRGRTKIGELKKLEAGIELEDGWTAPAKVWLISYSRSTDFSKIQITIHEGRKRQVRRMLAAIGRKIETLSRIRFGDIELRGVPEGQYRYLTEREIADLRRLALRPNPRKENDH